MVTSPFFPLPTTSLSLLSHPAFVQLHPAYSTSTLANAMEGRPVRGSMPYTAIHAGAVERQAWQGGREERREKHARTGHSWYYYLDGGSTRRQAGMERWTGAAPRSAPLQPSPCWACSGSTGVVEAWWILHLNSSPTNTYIGTPCCWSTALL